VVQHSHAVLLALPLLAGVSCRTTPSDCKHESSERCLWERAVVEPDNGEGQLDGAEFGNDPDGTDPTERAELEHTLSSVIEIMRGGLEWPLVDQRARTLCRREDADGTLVEAQIEADETGLAWSCAVANLEIDGQSLALEASRGVISLSASDLDAARSEELLERARTQFAHKCAAAFEELEGAKLEVFHRCALPEGPYLVVARFPADAEAERWQISIAVVDAG
jgi:hypothetical protein